MVITKAELIAKVQDMRGRLIAMDKKYQERKDKMTAMIEILEDAAYKNIPIDPAKWDPLTKD